MFITASGVIMISRPSPPTQSGAVSANPPTGERSERMAYRNKGFLTMKQRGSVVEFITDYYNFVSDANVSEALKVLAEAVFFPWVLMCYIALYMDEVKILEKKGIIGGENKV